MNNIIDFLISREVILVYVLAGLAITVALVFYLKDKSNLKKQLKQNTKELNDLVQQVAQAETTESPQAYVAPVAQQAVVAVEPVQNVEPLATPQVTVPEVSEVAPVIPQPMVEVAPIQTAVPIVEEVPVEEISVQPSIIEALPEVVELPAVAPVVESLDEIKPEVILEEKENVVTYITNEENKQVEEIIEYTDAEPDQTTAQAELEKLALELQEKEAAKNIELTDFELKQEENAIISLDELMQKSTTMYEANEITQYADEGDEPISIQDLEERMNKIKADVIMLEAPKNEEVEILNEPIVQHIETLITPDAKPKVILDDLYTIEEKDIPKPKTGFQSSPIISPIYGITGTSPIDTNLELENTANYDKLDEEIRKTNEFLMTLRELQKNLE